MFAHYFTIYYLLINIIQHDYDECQANDLMISPAQLFQIFSLL